MWGFPLPPAGAPLNLGVCIWGGALGVFFWGGYPPLAFGVWGGSFQGEALPPPPAPQGCVSGGGG